MSIEKVFRWLVAIAIVSIIPAFWIDYAAIVDLSDTNLDYEYLTSLSDSHYEVIFGENIFAMTLLLFVLIASYFLIFFYIKYSRELFVSLTVFMVFLDILGGTWGSFTFLSVLEDVFYSVGAMLDGALIAIMYLTPLKEKFNRT